MTTAAMTIASYTVLAYALIAYMLLPQRLLPNSSRAPLLRTLIVIAFYIALVIPFGDTRPMEALRAVTADFSITTLVLLVTAAGARIRNRTTPPGFDARSTLLLIVAAAIFLYPAGLGAGQWDPYRLGYGLGLPLICAAVVLAAFTMKQYLAALAVSFALLAYALRLLESENLWDYLLDPWVTIYAITRLVRRPPLKQQFTSRSGPVARR